MIADNHKHLGAVAPLGIYAETYSTPATARVSDDGEVLDIPRDSRTARAERWALKAAARRLLPKDHRTTKCMRWRLPDRETQVCKGVTQGKAFYQGLQVCAMPWACPVCASKISERRRHEVAKAMKQAEALGLQVHLLTLTIPHGIGDDVSALVSKMGKAWTSLWQGRRGVERRESLGLVGHIRALEVTHGANGFHPHYHALMFFDPERSTEAGWCALPGIWQKVATRAGLPSPSLEHGCKVDDGSKAAQYVSKGVWGLESEVTKGHVKAGKTGHAHRLTSCGLPEGRQASRGALAGLCGCVRGQAATVLVERAEKAAFCIGAFRRGNCQQTRGRKIAFARNHHR